MARTDWLCALVLMTWQKVAPIVIVARLQISEVSLVMLVAVMNRLLGAWGGLNQTQFRPLLGYSSIVHIGWMVALVAVSGYRVVGYLVVYRALVVPLVACLDALDTPKVFHLLVNLPLRMAVCLMLFLFNLAGLPPFSGFFLKATARALLIEDFPQVVLLLLLGRGLRLGFYLNLVVLVLRTAHYHTRSGVRPNGLFLVLLLVRLFLGPWLVQVV